MLDPSTLGLRNLLYFGVYTSLFNGAQACLTPFVQRCTYGLLNRLTVRNGRKRAQPMLVAAYVAALTASTSYLFALDLLCRMYAISPRK